MIRNNKAVMAVVAGAVVLTICGSHKFNTAYTADNNSTVNYTIENGVLKKAHNLSGEVRLPDTITSIDNYAFDETCSGITKLIIPGSVKKVTTNSVYDLYDSVEDLEIEEGVEEIDDLAFSKFSKLKSVKLPKSLTRIGNAAFADCSSLKEIKIPENIEKLEGCTFAHCTSLFKIEMPDNLTTFKQYDFLGTPWLESLKDDNGFYIYKDILLDTDHKMFSNDIVIPDGIREIGPESFFGADNIIETITMPDSVEIIREGAFMSCSRVHDVKHSENLKTIGESAFLGCDLKEINIPASVTSIGGSAFNDDEKITGEGENLDAVIKDMKAHKDDGFQLDILNYPGGWIEYNEHKLYKNSLNVLQKGWMDLDGKRYYFYSNGFLATGFIKLSNTAFYYSDPLTGELLDGWIYTNNNWYYFNPEAFGDKEQGWMQTSWKNINDKWYFFYSDGTMATGFINPFGDEYYYLDESSSGDTGTLQTGWQYINGFCYYFNNSSDGIEGLMSKGWKEIDGEWYYFYYEDGKMACNTWIDGYYVNSNGICDK